MIPSQSSPVASFPAVVWRAALLVALFLHAVVQAPAQDASEVEAPPAPPFRATLELSSRRTDGGMPVTLTVRLEATEPGATVTRFEVPDIGADSSYDLRLIEASTRTAPSQAAGRVFPARFEVYPLEHGVIEVLSPAFSWRASEGAEVQEAAAGAVGSTTLEVWSRVLGSEAVRDDLAGFPPPLTLAERAVQAAPWLAAGLLVLGALLAGAYALRRRLMMPAPPLAPEVWARRELAALRADAPTSPGQVEHWHYELGRIARGYAARRWMIAAERMTSDETLRSLERHAPDLPTAQRNQLAELMEECDGVKYAGEAASIVTAQGRADRLEAFIAATVPLASVPPAEPPAPPAPATTTGRTGLRRAA